MSKQRKPKFKGNVNVILSDVTDDNKLLEVVRSVMEPAVTTMVWRAAMLAKQFGLQAFESSPTPPPERPCPSAVEVQKIGILRQEIAIQGGTLTLFHTDENKPSWIVNINFAKSFFTATPIEEGKTDPIPAITPE